MTKRSIAMCAAVLLTGSVATVSGLGAQVELHTVSGSSIRSRADLEALLLQYQDVLQSPAYSDELKAETAALAEQIRTRLRDGDFRLGDAVVLTVENEPQLPDTVQVETGPDGPILSLPVFGTVSLQGVLRSEVEERIETTLSQYLRNPVVRAEGLMRLSVQGAVTAPGFYVVPADILLSQALMVAGGPTQNSAIDELRIERGPLVLMEGEQLQEELRLGRTLDQLNLQAGDQLLLPAETPSTGVLSRIAIVAGVLSSVSILVIQLAR